LNHPKDLPTFETMKINSLLYSFFAVSLLISCSGKNSEPKEEQIHLTTDTLQNTDTTSANTLQGDLSFAQLATYPNKVILTGLPDQRLVTIYKRIKKGEKGLMEEYGPRKSYYYDDSYRDYEEHFMPGIDLVFGYNLVNIGHYNFATEKLSLLFDHPVLVKSLYYPSFEQDSLNKKPINRNYFLLSVYNEDTNKDTLISKADLRRFYFFNATASERLQVIPSDYSVERSQYDSMRDVMYIFARQDENKNGKSDPTEPLHVFWFSLARPHVAKRMY
jgi:hypothetical protein